VKQHLHILKEGTGAEVKEFFGDRDKFEQVQMHCALAAYHTAAGRAERDRTARTEHFARAATLLSDARRIAYEEQLPFLGLGQLAVARVRFPLLSCLFSSQDAARTWCPSWGLAIPLLPECTHTACKEQHLVKLARLAVA